ncbi:hypothetical protein J437_LFUL018153 [Ladona fulva]|uniref:PiggyBac transposable element-derived protein domain-containing protein n=1 Tax=Ladona fulva TaxID=123851 RepID=A0A8K0KPL1_LADFU|nr:hypothetical protein J437_LFUL018153 [Ladona fulva]
MGKCTLMSAEELEKFPRGYNDYRFESNNEIFIVRWKDNKCVAVATNIDTLEPTVQVMRWCKERSAKAYVPQPALINNYNKYMGGVDMHDWLLEKHAIAIKAISLPSGPTQDANKPKHRLSQLNDPERRKHKKETFFIKECG